MRFGRAFVDDYDRASAIVGQALDGFVQSRSADFGLDSVEHEVAEGMERGLVVCGADGFKKEARLAHA